MSPFRRLRVRALAALSVALIATGLGAGRVFAHGDAAPSSPTSGVVVIETNLGYQQSAAAGTGMVLTSSGEVLTNNHVIRGATSIKVVVPQTGRTYSATVAGYSIGTDAAVLKLQHASGLATVSLGDSAKLRVGQAVRAVGNAGGTGRLTIARGRVTGLGKSITVSDDQGGSARLTSLVETSAALQPGDSGGPLLDASGHVIGMDAAASVSQGFSFQAPAGDAYAIPINRALTVVKQIDAGRASASVHVGPTAFLGVGVAAASDIGYGDGSAGAFVTSVVTGSPADRAAITRGDEITAVAGKPVSSPASVIAILLGKKPGSTVALTWVDGYGQQQTANVTLTAGPPQ
jgi:S1-C subfamily serine protease